METETSKTIWHVVIVTLLLVIVYLILTCVCKVDVMSWIGKLILGAPVDPNTDSTYFDSGYGFPTGASGYHMNPVSPLNNPAIQAIQHYNASSAIGGNQKPVAFVSNAKEHIPGTLGGAREFTYPTASFGSKETSFNPTGPGPLGTENEESGNGSGMLGYEEPPMYEGKDCPLPNTVRPKQKGFFLGEAYDKNISLGESQPYSKTLTLGCPDLPRPNLGASFSDPTNVSTHIENKPLNLPLIQRVQGVDYIRGDLPIEPIKRGWFDLSKDVKDLVGGGHNVLFGEIPRVSGTREQYQNLQPLGGCGCGVNNGFLGGLTDQYETK